MHPHNKYQYQVQIQIQMQVHGAEGASFGAAQGQQQIPAGQRLNAPYCIILISMWDASL